MASYDYKDYGALAGNQLVFNSGNTRIIGQAGSNFSPGGPSLGSATVSNGIYSGTDVSNPLISAQNDYSGYMGYFPDSVIPDADIGGRTFTPGVIQLSNPGPITIGSNVGDNVITLNGVGNYFFQVPNGNLSTVTTSASVSFNLINGAHSSQVYWFINGSVLLDSTVSNITNFIGTILAKGNITMNTNSTNLGTVVAFDSTDNVILNQNNITSTNFQASRETSTNGYINTESTLADNKAITINSSSEFGGILIKSGTGGITQNSTNTISLNAEAASNFTTSNGNLTLQATAGLTNIDGGSGINIGNTLTTGSINISTANNRQINIGNSAGVSQVNVTTGTGGFNINTNNGAIALNSNNTTSNFTNFTNADGQDLNIALVGATNSKIKLDSQGTGTNAIELISTGGIVNSSDGPIQLASSASSGAAINLDTFPNGGINISSGSFGIGINSNGAALGIGHFSGGPVYFATASAARDIYFGSNEAAINIYERYGNALTTTQYLETVLVDPGVGTNINLTVAEILGRIVYGSPAFNITLTIPATSEFITALPNLQTNDSLDFSVINESTTNSYTLIASSKIGNAVVSPGISAIFRIKFTGTPVISPTGYILYRIN